MKSQICARPWEQMCKKWRLQLALTHELARNSCTLDLAMVGPVSKRRDGSDPHGARGQVSALARGASGKGQYRTQNPIAGAYRSPSRRRQYQRGKMVAVLGVTFKPNTDDMREAPSLMIVPMLQARGACIRACDPQGRSKAEALLPGVVWCESALEAACKVRTWLSC